MKTRTANYILWGIVLFSFLLRAIGSIHDLPFSYFGDEEHFIKRTLSFGSGDFNPHWFHKPAFYMYLLFVEYGVFFIVGYIAGLFESVDGFATYYFTDQRYFLLIGRGTTILFSCGMIGLTYLIGKRFGGSRIGLIAAFFLACTYGNFQSSIVVKADIPAAFFALLSLYCAIMIYERGANRYYAFSGIFAGLGAATKYYPVTVLVCIWVAHFLRAQSTKDSLLKKIAGPPLMGMLACFCLAFFIGSPYSFLDPNSPFRDIYTQIIAPMTVTAIDEDGNPLTKAVGVGEKIQSIIFSFYVTGKTIVDGNAMGLVLGGVGIGGLLYWVYLFLWADWKIGIVLAYVMAFVFAAAIFSPSFITSRYLNLIYPALCLGGAQLTNQAASMLSVRLGLLKCRKWAVVFFCVIFSLPSLYQVVAFDYLATHKDTRLLAKEWVEANVPAGSKIVLDEKGPRLKMNEKNLRDLLRRAQAYSQPGPFTTHLGKYYQYQLRALSGVTYDILQISHPWWLVKEDKSGSYRMESIRDADMGNPVKERGVMSLEYYRKQGYQYVVTTSATFEKYLRKDQREKFPSIFHFYQDLFSLAVMVKEFRPNAWSRPGPIVKIFKIQ